MTSSGDAFINPVGPNTVAAVKGITVGATGTNSAGAAAVTAPALVSGTAAQVSTTQDTTLYGQVNVGAAVGTLTVQIGPTAAVAAATPINAAALAVTNDVPFDVLVPAGWYVKVTVTGAGVTLGAFTAIGR